MITLPTQMDFYFNQSFIITVTLLALVEWSALAPFKMIGFYCKDPKLAFKNEGEVINTITLLFISFVVPYIIFVIVEWSVRTDVNSSKTVIKSSWLRKAHLSYFTYMHGLCFTFLITDVLKIVAGEPRPDFLDTCKPREAENCVAGEYFSAYTCTNSLSAKKLMDSYKSFPSGHASFSFFASSFFAIYFSRKIRTTSLFLLNLLNLICVCWALICSLTRITDHRHHWWDVLVGSIIGFSAAMYFSFNRRDNIWNKKFDDENRKHFESTFLNSNK